MGCPGCNAQTDRRATGRETFADHYSRNAGGLLRGMRALDGTARRSAPCNRARSSRLSGLVPKEGADSGENRLLAVESYQLVSLGGYSRQKNHLVSAVRRGRRVGKSRTGDTRKTIKSGQGAIRLCLVLVPRGRSCVF